MEEVLDYLREVIEEGLNLDVAGDALVERLSLQCVHSAVLPCLTELVLSLGLTRLSVCGLGSVSVDDAEVGEVEVVEGSGGCAMQLLGRREYGVLVGSLYGQGGAIGAIKRSLSH